MAKYATRRGRGTGDAPAPRSSKEGDRGRSRTRIGLVREDVRADLVDGGDLG